VNPASSPSMAPIGVRDMPTMTTGSDALMGKAFL
jgi:hypothetical protein